MQQWTLDRTSESPESSGRPSGLPRESKLFRGERRSTRLSARAERRRVSQEASPAEPLFTPCRREDSGVGRDEDEEEGRRSGPRRLSRHIPQRVGTDMTVSSFNLMAATTCTSQTSSASPHTVHSRTSHAQAAARHTTAAASANTSAAAAAAAVVGGLGGHGAPAAAQTPSSSALTSFSESMISDDSSYLTSLYNDVLADHLIGHRSGGTIAHAAGGAGDAATSGPYPRHLGPPGSNAATAGASTAGVADERGIAGRSRHDERGSGRRTGDEGAVGSARRGLGGEVLRFGDVAPPDAPSRAVHPASPTDSAPLRLASFSKGGSMRGQPSAQAASAGLAAALPRSRARTIYTTGSGGRAGAASRIYNTTPERVLDAPQFPANAAQLLDWGANNCIAIGMGQSLYSWSGDSGQATKVVDLDDAVRIRCVQWLHKCSCVAMSVQDGTTAIFDCRSSSFLRTVRLPSGLEVSRLSVKGPVLAVASSSPHGTTCAFDLRAKEALVATYEGHGGGVTSLHYCAAEPFYLASGGCDGAVRVWDARRAATPRYAFDGVHHGRVNAIRWDPQKRSRLFTGGEDGVMSLMDTHAPQRTIEMDPTADEEGCGGAGGVGSNYEQLAQYVTRAVNTQHPISDLVCHGTQGEVVTAHRGKGQLQLRKASTFHLLSTFTALHCEASLTCLTMAPDQERVCAAQEDETLKFWRVFDNNAARASERGSGVGRVGPSWTPPPQDAGSFVEEPLR